MPNSNAIPKATAFRLSLYLRELCELRDKDVMTTSSAKLAKMLGISDAQVRKDLAYFGQFGHPGVGYVVEDLIEELKRILGTDRMWDVVLVGCGNLGSALAAYGGFERQGFRICAAFDASPARVGKTVGDLTVQSMDELGETVKRTGARIAVICVPNNQAQVVADAVVEAGVKGILNFASTSIATPPGVIQNAVDLAIRLEQLTFQLRKPPGAGRKSGASAAKRKKKQA